MNLTLNFSVPSVFLRISAFKRPPHNSESTHQQQN